MPRVVLIGNLVQVTGGVAPTITIRRRLVRRETISGFLMATTTRSTSRWNSENRSIRSASTGLSASAASRALAAASSLSSSHPRTNGDVASVSHPEALQAAKTGPASSVVTLNGRMAKRKSSFR